MYNDMMENYNYLVMERGMSLTEVDNMEIDFYFELMNFNFKKKEKEKEEEEKKLGKLITEGRFAGEREVSYEQLSIGR